MTVFTCPRCRKTLSNTPAVAQFCMYCGTRLSTSQDSPLNDQTADLVTRSHLPGVPSIADDFEDDVPNDLPPREVGGYSLIRILGAGGQGNVYEAEQCDSGQRVAVKLLSSKFAGSAISVERFRQEGRLASQIAHPRCVFVYGADTDAGVPFIVMELMPGTTLKDLVDRKGPLPVGEAIARILDVIDGLIEAHRLGVIHRDVKPSNCFITADDRVKIGDFGLSKSLMGSNPAKQLTTTGKFVGTVLFAPPEQIRGEEVGYDSDVYSVAATMYFLLTGKAPHQHESLTAALAKAISEPPPPIRNLRPDVPKELERACFRGLERERNRRWQSLEEFRDALLELLPSRHTPARPRTLVAAYLIDALICYLVVLLPIDIARDLLLSPSKSSFGVWIYFDPLSWAAAFFYFALFEGLLGWTPGKWFIRLRVVRMGETGPPGLSLAFKRTGIFLLNMFGIVVMPFLLVRFAKSFGSAVIFMSVILAIGFAISGVVAMMNQFRRKWSYRGIHDLVTGTRVVQRPSRVIRRRLVSRYPNPLDQFVKPAADLPTTVGGFRVKGQLGETGKGNLIWLAEDHSLSRRILLWLRKSDGVLPPIKSVVRPTRLRQVGEGTFDWNRCTYEWTGFVAPAGAPLADVVDPERTISWSETRPLLEQLADELLTAQSDGSLPARIGLDQLWIEPAGRLHLLEFPLTSGRGIASKSSTPLNLIRHTASLALQGTPWKEDRPIEAPIPPHATALTDRLTDPDTPYTDLVVLLKDLSESHAQVSHVNSAARLTHVGLQGMFLIIPHMLAFLLLYIIALPLLGLLPATTEAKLTEMYATSIHNPEIARAVARTEAGRMALSQQYATATMAEMDRRSERQQIELRKMMQETLSAPEQSFLTWIVELIVTQWDEDSKLQQIEFAANSAYITVLKQEKGDPPVDRNDTLRWVPLYYFMLFALIFLMVFLINRFVCAFLFRGGFSWLLMGISLIDRRGQPCNRLRCGVRALAVWAPISLLCLLLLFVEYEFPIWIAVRVFLVMTLLVTLMSYVVIAIRYPSRPPQDRLMGTYIMPR
ncbi:MAG: protein kinase [Gemmataceae bacterium]